MRFNCLAWSLAMVFCITLFQPGCKNRTGESQALAQGRTAGTLSSTEVAQALKHLEEAEKRLSMAKAILSGSSDSSSGNGGGLLFCADSSGGWIDLIDGDEFGCAFEVKLCYSGDIEAATNLIKRRKPHIGEANQLTGATHRSGIIKAKLFDTESEETVDFTIGECTSL